MGGYLKFQTDVFPKIIVKFPPLSEEKSNLDEFIHQNMTALLLRSLGCNIIDVWVLCLLRHESQDREYFVLW